MTEPLRYYDMYLFKHKLDETAAHLDRLIIKKKCELQEECVICLETVYQKKIMYLPCKHYFHHGCIMHVFDTKKYSCPLCRRDVTQALKKINYPFPVTRTFYAYGYNYAGTADANAADANAADANAADANAADANAADANAADANAPNLILETLYSIYSQAQEMGDAEESSLINEIIMFYYI